MAKKGKTKKTLITLKELKRKRNECKTNERSCEAT